MKAGMAIVKNSLSSFRVSFRFCPISRHIVPFPTSATVAFGPSARCKSGRQHSAMRGAEMSIW
eukprot:1872670-Rhodomonas_salina.1